MARRVTLEQHIADEYVTDWGRLVEAYPQLAEELPDGVAAAIEAEIPLSNYSAVAQYLQLPPIRDNLIIQAALLAVDTAAEQIGAAWDRRQALDAAAGRPEDCDGIIPDQSSRWAHTLSDLSQRVVHCAEMHRAQNIEELGAYLRTPDDDPEMLWRKHRAYDGASIPNVLSLLARELVLTVARRGIVVDERVSIGPLSETSNLVARTRDMYLCLVETVRTTAAAWHLTYTRAQRRGVQ